MPRAKPAFRSYWKGHLRLSLVTIAVEVFAAVDSSAKISLHQIHEPSRRRIQYQKYVPEIGAVDNSDIVKAYEIEEGRYVVLSDDELESLKLESTQTIELVQFVEY